MFVSFFNCYLFSSTYPLTAPVYSDRGYVRYRIAMVTDLDTDSKHPTEKNTWISYLKKVFLNASVITRRTNLTLRLLVGEQACSLI